MLMPTLMFYEYPTQRNKHLWQLRCACDVEQTWSVAIVAAVVAIYVLHSENSSNIYNSGSFISHSWRFASSISRTVIISYRSVDVIAKVMTVVK